MNTKQKDLLMELAEKSLGSTTKQALKTLRLAGILTKDGEFTENFKHLNTMDEFESAKVATEFNEAQEKKETEARRYNKDKPREELACKQADMFKIRRYTKGAEKYTIRNNDGIVDDGADNWKKGMSFKKLIGSSKRHLSAIERGENIDWDWDKGLNKKFGLSTHFDGLMWNAEVMLHHYINNYHDDRVKQFYNPRIALDLDGVVFSINKLLGLEDPKNYADPEFLELYGNLKENPEDLFHCPIFEDALDMPFEPVCYITARPDSLAEYTKESLVNSKLPYAPIIHTNDKLKACKENEIEIFVEDKWDTFCKLNFNGIKTFLMDRRYNRKHDAGRLRIKSLKQVI